jgi:UDPglucose 6-dehydrogenase
MQVSVIGLGYVGLVTSACLAEWGHQVVGADNSRQRISALLNGTTPFHEPGLDELVARNLDEGRLQFTSSPVEAARKGEVVIVAVGTHDGNGGWQTVTVQSCLAEIAPVMADDATLVIRSTMPPAFISHLKAAVRAVRAEAGLAPIPVMLNPEFTREGRAIRDFMEPDRLVFGSVDDPDGVGRDRLTDLYASATAPTLTMPAMDAAFAKLASNLFLATKISFANELAALCDHYGAQIDNVVATMAHDPRIGGAFLHAGVGFGGSCLPNQVSMTVRDARRDGVASPLLEAVDAINHRQRTGLVERLESVLGSLEGHRIALLGLTFKPDTDDLRDAPALTVAARLIDAGATVVAYDPMPTARHHAPTLVPGLHVVDDAVDAMRGASAVALLTEWPEFRAIDWHEAADIVKRRIVFDGRNALPPEQLGDAGFAYLSFGRMAASRQAVRIEVEPATDGAWTRLGAAREAATSRATELAGS